MSRYAARIVTVVDGIMSITTTLLLISEVIQRSRVNAAKNIIFEAIQEILDPSYPAYSSVKDTAVRLYVAYGLWSATKIGGEPFEAWRLAWEWRNVTVQSLMIDLFNIVSSGWNVMIAIRVMVRGGMFLIVRRYMQELERYIEQLPV